MSANAKLNTNPIALVNNADYAVLVRASKDKPVLLPGVRQAFITGGKRFNGNGYQSSAHFDGRHFRFWIRLARHGRSRVEGRSQVLADRRHAHPVFGW